MKFASTMGRNYLINNNKNNLFIGELSGLVISLRVVEIGMTVRIDTFNLPGLVSMVRKWRADEIFVNLSSFNPDIRLPKPNLIRHPARLKTIVKALHRVDVLQLTTLLKTFIFLYTLLNSLMYALGNIVDIHIVLIFMHIQAVHYESDSQ